MPRVGESERRAYDAGNSGEAAPETVFVSRGEVARLCANFSRVEARLENAGGDRLTALLPRRLLLPTLGRAAGLDIYTVLIK